VGEGAQKSEKKCLSGKVGWRDRDNFKKNKREKDKERENAKLNRPEEQKKRSERQKKKREKLQFRRLAEFVRAGSNFFPRHFQVRRFHYVRLERLDGV
jgi:hypothetical protein